MSMEKDKQRLRDLAKQWSEIAGRPEMKERKEGWTALHSLRPIRPMMLVETGYIENFVRPDEKQCEDAYCRNVEQYMLDKIIHANEVGDDIVFEDYFRMGWHMDQPSYGVEVEMEKPDENGLAYVFKHSIKSPEDIKQLVKREFSVDRERTMKYKSFLEETFGDILPVRLGNYGFMDAADGMYDWVGDMFFGLTWQLHRFVGMDEMMYWYYDYPDEMHALMQYVVDDRLRMFRLLEKEGCLVPNTDNEMAGPCFYGYCDDLPKEEAGTPGTLKQMWAWSESQESTSISVEMYQEFVLPYLAQLAKEFGLVYYGCCEPLDNKLDVIADAIPNMRAVSVSMWNDFDVIGKLIGKRFVYSRKPSPPPMSGATVDWDAVKKDIRMTIDSAQGCALEFLFRDLYEINGERGRLAEWTRLLKVELDI